MQPDRDDAAYLFDMLKYARTVERLVAGRDFDSFLRDEVLRLAVERAVEIIGEAARGVSQDLQTAHPEIPWRLIAAQRHVLAHDYGDVIPEKIWRVATFHVPALVVQLEPLVPPPPPDPEPG